MGNTTDEEEGGEAQKDEIPRDTQLDRQYIESPSNKDIQDNQEIQTNQINQVNQVSKIITESPINQMNQVIIQEKQINELNKIDPNQINKINQNIEQSNQNYFMMQEGGQQNSIGQGGVMQYNIQQGTQEIQPNIEQVQYEVSQQYNNQGSTQYIQPNNEMQNSQGYEMNQLNQGYEINQDNQGGVQEHQEYYANQ